MTPKRSERVDTDIQAAIGAINAGHYERAKDILRALPAPSEWREAMEAAAKAIELWLGIYKSEPPEEPHDVHVMATCESLAHVVRSLPAPPGKEKA